MELGKGSFTEQATSKTFPTVLGASSSLGRGREKMIVIGWAMHMLGRLSFTPHTEENNV